MQTKQTLRGRLNTFIALIKQKSGLYIVQIYYEYIPTYIQAKSSAVLKTAFSCTILSNPREEKFHTGFKCGSSEVLRKASGGELR